MMAMMATNRRDDEQATMQELQPRLKPDRDRFSKLKAWTNLDRKISIFVELQRIVGVPGRRKTSV